jgi:hypothetical protein
MKERLLSPSLSSILNGGEGRGEEALGCRDARMPMTSRRPGLWTVRDRTQ